MKKRLISVLLGVAIIVCLSGCAKEITLNLAYGDRTGSYSGEMKDGVPDGKGKFTTKNEDGETWTYEGYFKNGHFEGEGKTTWKSGQVEMGTYKDDVLVPLKGDELKSLFTTPEKFKSHCAELIGKVFKVEYTDDGVAVQMWQDFKSCNNNIIVYVLDSDFKVKEDEFLKVTGIVGDVFEGENMMGAKITAPTITAREYSVVDYMEAAMPAKKTLDVNQTQTQYGYSVTVQKVEFADEETRVYVKVDNGGSDKFSLYSFNAKLVQNGKQYDEQSNFEADYPEIQSDLLVGSSSEGIIAFPAIKEEGFNLIFEAYSDNFYETINPYTFEIK